MNLMVTDADGAQSAEDTMILTVKSKPIADAGIDQSIHAGNLVTLDGSNSFDPDGDTPLQYSWSFVSKPETSAASLTGAGTSVPSFTADVWGNYILQLIVTDSKGVVSDPDKVLVSTINAKPVADAGPDQAVSIRGTVVQLNGGGSDDPDNDPISYAWSFVQKPEGSLAVLSYPASSSPTFVADLPGEDYIVQLIVQDTWGAVSDPDTVVISFANVPPVADAGNTQSVVVGEMVQLDGSGSSDANNDPLTYSWSITEKPATSATALSNPSNGNPTFVPDIDGTYTVTLVVNDGLIDSVQSSVTIVAITKQSKGTQLLDDVITKIGDLPDISFGNKKNMGNTLSQKASVIISKIANGEYAGALDQLENDLMAKTDGCATTGAPDGNDKITDCAAQAQIYPLLQQVRQILIDLISG